VLIGIGGALAGVAIAVTLVLVTRHRAQASGPPATTAPAPAAPTTPMAPTTTTDTAAASLAPPPAPAAPPPPSAPAPPAADTAAAAPAGRFLASTAKQALDATAHDVLHCRRGKVWGIASANVTFASDGSVSRVAVGVPFTGTTTGQCVADALGSAHVPAFSGRPQIVTYKFFVGAK
jgi:hypothetical protein